MRIVTPLRLHRAVVVGLYLGAYLIASRVFASLGATASGAEVLATGAIFATFGSAIMSLGAIFAGDMRARVEENISILFAEVLRTPPWRRWPFLLRKESTKLFDGSRVVSTLENPVIDFDVGSHKIRIAVPTVPEDFFDLPLIDNVMPLVRWKRTFLTAHSRRLESPRAATPGSSSVAAREEAGPEGWSEKLSTFLCLYDTWLAILRFRVARYVTHFGGAIVLASVGVVVRLF